MEYGESANGQQISVKHGEEFDIALPEVRTAGYQWKMQNAAVPQSELVEEKAESDASHSGGAGKHRWRFRASAEGNAELEFHYVRPWQKSEGPAKTFKVKVQVRP